MDETRFEELLRQAGSVFRDFDFAYWRRQPVARYLAAVPFYLEGVRLPARYALRNLVLLLADHYGDMGKPEGDDLDDAEHRLYVFAHYPGAQPQAVRPLMFRLELAMLRHWKEKQFETNFAIDKEIAMREEAVRREPHAIDQEAALQLQAYWEQ